MTDRPEPRYVLNVNPGGLDVLHRDPGESCNTQGDEMPGRQRVDTETAVTLERSGDVRLCEHCYPQETPT